MDREEDIWKDLRRGMSLRAVAEKYGLKKDKVNSIKKQGKYYLNLDTGEEEFSAKKISIERQIYHYLLSKGEIRDHKKLEEYLEVDRSTLFRWKDKPKLVDMSIIMDRVNEFLEIQSVVAPKERKNKIGLYFLYQDNKLMYIGKSKDINKRLYQHSYNSHVDLQGEYDVKIIIIGNEKDTELAERVYISMLKPPLNIEFKDELECGGFFSELMNRIPKEYSKRITIKEKCGKDATR